MTSPGPESLTKAVWGVVNSVGLRRASSLGTQLIPAYRNTISFFEGVDGHVALTIDDGLCRTGAENSLVGEVASLLRKHRARATFFICSDYLAGCEAAAADLIADGHEFANHMPADRKDYASLGEAEFERQLCRTTAAIEAVAGAGRVRWFRAPSGRFTRTMQAVTERHGLRHALGDAYCDDWRVPGDVRWVADTMLAQAQAGSVCIVHMPERGFREHTLQASQRQ